MNPRFGGPHTLRTQLVAPVLPKRVPPIRAESGVPGYGSWQAKPVQPLQRFLSFFGPSLTTSWDLSMTLALVGGTRLGKTGATSWVLKVWGPPKRGFLWVSLFKTQNGAFKVP